MSKKTYKCTITFFYDSEDGAPLSGNPITHPDHAIEAVRDELENATDEFEIECGVYDENGEFEYAIKG